MYETDDRTNFLYRSVPVTGFKYFSLNAEHDGHGNNCSATSGYVMDAKTGASNDSFINKRLWIFSSCSIDYFDTFIKQLNR